MTTARRQPAPVPAGLEVLTPAQVSTLTGRHVETVTLALRNKELRGKQRVEGGRWYVRREDAIAWMVGEQEEVA